MADIRTNVWKPIEAGKTGISDKYIGQASAQLDSNYNTQLNTAQNKLNQGLSDLEASKIGINKNFDTQQAENKNNTMKTQNAFNNNMISRNTGRSSIATSGMAQIDATGQRLHGELETGRATELSDVDKKKTSAQLDFDSYKANLEAERMDKVLALARELEEKQKAIEREEYWKQKDYELRLQQAKRSSGGGGGGGYRYYGGGSSGGSSSKAPTSSAPKTPTNLRDLGNRLPHSSTGSSLKNNSLIKANANKKPTSIMTQKQPAPKKTFWQKLFGK